MAKENTLSQSAASGCVDLQESFEISVQIWRYILKFSFFERRNLKDFLSNPSAMCAAIQYVYISKLLSYTLFLNFKHFCIVYCFQFNRLCVDLVRNLYDKDKQV